MTVTTHPLGTVHTMACLRVERDGVRNVDTARCENFAWALGAPHLPDIGEPRCAACGHVIAVLSISPPDGPTHVIETEWVER